MVALTEARRIAAQAAPAEPVARPLREAIGHVLAETVVAQADVPPAATSAMDGWAVRGSGPWHMQEPGREAQEALDAGTATPVVTGSVIPAGATSVLRTEHGRLDGTRLSADPAEGDVTPGRDIRPVGTEALRGDVLVERGRLLTPVRAALAATGGHDQVRVVPAPRVDLVTTGGEVVAAGLPAPGQVRDVFGVALPEMIAALGGTLGQHERIGDAAAPLLHRLTASGPDASDVLIVTGGTAHSSADAVRPALAQAGAEVLIASVDMSPGHPVVLARLDHGSSPRHVLALPGNPLAGLAALTALGGPLLAALRGQPDAGAWPTASCRTATELSGRPGRVRLVPVRLRAGEVAAIGHDRPHMMRGLASADAFAVVPAEGLAAGDPVAVLAIPGVTMGGA